MSWFGLWDDTGGVSGSEGAVRAAFEVPGRAGVERLAPTFAAMLGVQPPREALGEALPIPGIAAPSQPMLAPRVSAVRGAYARDAARARGGIAMRAVVLACLAMLGVIAAVRAGRGRGLAGAALVVLGACVGFALAGPGWTLSAIRTQGAYLARALSAMGVGALLAWVPARRLGARLSEVIALGACIPLSALALTLGTSGYAGESNTALLLWPSAGLVPTAVALAAFVRWLLRALRQRARRTGAPKPDVA